MSGLYPGAKHQLIPAGDNDPPIVPRLAILHVAVSIAASLFSFFRFRSGGIESHFYVTLFGRVKQYRSIYREADANWHANPFAVSIETAGWATGKWNRRQRRAIQALLLWLNEETDGAIPLAVPATWDGSGVGYHIQFGSPGEWTPVAKSCPGPERVKQYWRWLVPWMKSDPTSPEEDDMPFSEKELRKIIREEAAKAVDDVLDVDMNAHEPKGSAAFRGVTLRTLLKAIGVKTGAVKPPRD